MNNTITFYTNPMSRGRIAHWMLEEVGAPYEVKLLDFGKKEHKQPSYLAVNPMGKVPTIVHRGTVIFETAAICTYLADAFPAAKLAPALDDPKRGAYLRWMFFGAGCMEPAIIDKMLARAPAEKTSAIGYGTYQETMNAVENALAKSPFLLGDQFNAADLYVSSQLGFAMMVKALDPKPIFQNYVARCSERPAYKRFDHQSNQFVEKMKS